MVWASASDAEAAPEGNRAPARFPYFFSRRASASLTTVSAMLSGTGA